MNVLQSAAKQSVDVVAGGRLGSTEKRSSQDKPKEKGGTHMSIFHIVNARMKSKAKAAKARQVLDSLPEWLTPELLNQTTRRVRQKTGGNPARIVRSFNQVLQIEQPLWKLLIEFTAMPDKGLSQKQRLFDLVEEQHERFLKRYPEAEVGYDELLDHGPGGDTPLHLCFLLGLPELGKELAIKYYKTSELLSCPYGDDLKPWRLTKVVPDDEDANDGGLYTGQTVLHMCVAQLDHESCKWLLARGANVAARATGAFFQPLRRRYALTSPSFYRKIKAWVQDVNLKEHPVLHYVDVPDSGCYYGELPLSFAASVGDCELCDTLRTYFILRKEERDDSLITLYEETSKCDDEDCAKMRKQLEQHAEGGGSKRSHPAFSKGVDAVDYFTNARDKFGNTALHMAVLHKRTETISWLMANGGSPSLEVVNEEGFTPLTLSARKGLLGTFQEVLSHMQSVSWTFGDLKMAKYSLAQIDTFRIQEYALHQRPGWMSMVEIVVAHEVEEFASNDVFNRLIMEKWERFGRRHHLMFGILPFVFRLILVSFYLYFSCFLTRSQEEYFRNNGEHVWEGTDRSVGPTFDEFKFSLEGKMLTERWVRNGLQIASLLFVVVPGFVNGWHHRRLKDQDADPNEDGELSTYEIMIFIYKNLYFILAWGVSGSLLGGIIASALGNRLLEMQLLGISSVLHWAMLFLHLATFKTIGVLVIIVFKMLIGDIFKFVIVYLTLVMAFSVAFFALVQMADVPSAMQGMDSSIRGSIIQMILVSLGNKPTGVDFWPLIKETPNSSLTLTVYLVYVVLSALLLLNLLIAMMKKTFVADMQDRHRAWIFPFAHTILMYEKQLSEDDRARFRSGKPVGSEGKGDITLQKIKQIEYYDVHFGSTDLTADIEDMERQKEDHELLLARLTASLQTSLETFTAAIARLKSNMTESAWGKANQLSQRVLAHKKNIESQRRVRRSGMSSSVVRRASMSSVDTPGTVGTPGTAFDGDSSSLYLSPMQRSLSPKHRSLSSKQMVSPLAKPMTMSSRVGGKAHADGVDGSSAVTPLTSALSSTLPTAGRGAAEATEGAKQSHGVGEGTRGARDGNTGMGGEDEEEALYSRDVTEGISAGAGITARTSSAEPPPPRPHDPPDDSGSNATAQVGEVPLSGTDPGQTDSSAKPSQGNQAATHPKAVAPSKGATRRASLTPLPPMGSGSPLLPEASRRGNVGRRRASIADGTMEPLPQNGTTEPMPHGGEGAATDKEDKTTTDKEDKTS